MDKRDEQINLLQQQIAELNKRVLYLQSVLDDAHISYDEIKEPEQKQNAINQSQGSRIIKETITKKHVQFFYFLFKGRTDVYSKRSGKPNKKTGKTGYYTQCWNFWKDGVRPKKSGEKIKCGDCKNQRYKQLMGEDLYRHLIGEREDCSDVIGIYPMLEKETCHFLVFDFDNHEDNNTLDDGVNTDNDWIDEVNAMRQICRNNSVDILVERSRSGKGAHVWMFFEEALPAEQHWHDDLEKLCLRRVQNL